MQKGAFLVRTAMAFKNKTGGVFKEAYSRGH